MIEDDSCYNPSITEYDPEEDYEALITSLRLARRFVLLFVVTNSAFERNRRINAVAEQLSDKSIHHVAVKNEVENLLWHLDASMPDSKPDALFVYGLEEWISGTTPPRTVPFLLNLNAARDSFPLVLSVPMVFWVSQKLLNAIADAAPDFFSIRSGIYAFPLAPSEFHESVNATIRSSRFRARPYSDSSKRIEEMASLIGEYENLPGDRQDLHSQLTLLEALGERLSDQGRYYEAEGTLLRALAASKGLPKYNNYYIRFHLAIVCMELEKSSEAELYFKFLLTDLKKNVWRNSEYIRTMAMYGEFLRREGRIDEAAGVLSEAEELLEKGIADPLDGGDGLYVTVLNALALVYERQGKLDKVEALYNRVSTVINRLPSKDPIRAVYLNNLGQLYRLQGRYNEAEPPLVEALAIRREVFPPDHDETAISLGNLAELYRQQMRYKEAEPLYIEASEMLSRIFPPSHRTRRVHEHNFQLFTREKTANLGLLSNASRPKTPSRKTGVEYSKRPNSLQPMDPPKRKKR